MITHIFHDKNGTIKSLAFQSIRVQGTLELQSDAEGELVTVADIKEDFPESDHIDPEAEGSRDQLRRISHEIRTGFRLDVKRKRLEKLK
jgi:hypothetical protein